MRVMRAEALCLFLNHGSRADPAGWRAHVGQGIQIQRSSTMAEGVGAQKRCTI